MKRSMLLFLLVFLPACTFFQQFGRYRPEHAPAEEAARVQFPFIIPEESRLNVPGVTATAIQLAMDDFRPRNTRPHSGATPEEACLYRRESFNVSAFPGPEGVVFVRFVLDPEACSLSDPILDVGATYAVDVRGWRILAVDY
ncbi:hypothetical protein F0U60_49555 [Archangium minus]|uniref:Lipoprotein n=2 Tax=Archangium minus TaxID=83450 RepID=A0ABY9X7B6_9BACT|nr:hypothetical protein F0U61_49640 [Archangium violaceum]WNG51291.1 hypothetical protein F0U60_49555 [Archangium minus]